MESIFFHLNDEPENTLSHYTPQALLIENGHFSLKKFLSNYFFLMYILFRPKKIRSPGFGAKFFREPPKPPKPPILGCRGLKGQKSIISENSEI